MAVDAPSKESVLAAVPAVVNQPATKLAVEPVIEPTIESATNAQTQTLNIVSEEPEPIAAGLPATELAIVAPDTHTADDKESKTFVATSESVATITQTPSTHTVVDAPSTHPADTTAATVEPATSTQIMQTPVKTSRAFAVDPEVPVTPAPSELLTPRRSTRMALRSTPIQSAATAASPAKSPSVRVTTRNRRKLVVTESDAKPTTPTSIEEAITTPAPPSATTTKTRKSTNATEISSVQEPTKPAVVEDESMPVRITRSRTRAVQSATSTTGTAGTKRSRS
eukprot:c12211_g1_i1.p1 GENE.c12211_g1_i1~~c12211_g1_i1.p1  ORF type:complete len:292 (-),score=95.57 c12211_g1_i1:214-1059(-)